jgi:hypothetical protein
MRGVSPKRRGDAYKRTKAEKALGRVNGFGVCARCQRYTYVNGHERLSRSQGGDPTRPDCLLCVICNGWCEDKPQLAAWSGWKISRKESCFDFLTADQAMRTDGSFHTFAVLEAAS